MVWHPLSYYEKWGFRYAVINRKYRDLVREHPERWPEGDERSRQLETRDRLAVFEQGEDRIEVYRLY